ncbi:MAG: DUF3798 domain-containing protein [Clostridia bacterium]|nr:DUF3798 domain-containing protein [Clostridia bacterium]
MKLTSKTFRRILALVMAAALIFAMAGCKNDTGAKGEEVVIPQKKVAILVAPEAQYPEDYRAAKELEAEYPNSIIIKQYDDSRILKGGDPGIITLSKELAADPEIGAIIYARATQYTRNAIYKAKEINPELITACIEPEDNIEEIAELSNLVLCVDWSKAAEDIVAQAKDRGAKYFITFFVSRTMSGNKLIRDAVNAIKNACEAQGIKFINDSSADTNSVQIEGAQKYIREAIARHYMNGDVEGKDVAVFSTDSAVQSTLIEQANKKGLIYICPSFPTAYNGVGEVYDIEAPSKTSDIKDYIKNVKAAVEADTTGLGKLYIYKTPLATILLRGAVHSTFDLLNGTTTAENMAEKVTSRVSAAADSKEFTVEAYDDMANVFKAYQPGFEAIR